MKRIIQRVAAIVIGIGFGAVALAGLESVTHISDLNSSWPLGSDLASTSDDHIRNIKVALKTDFPSITGPVTVTQAQLNAVGASGITGFANPTGTAGLTAVNGSATTAMRSDGAPPLSQAIVPTWTGAHTWSSSATFNAGLAVNGSSRQLVSVTQSALAFGNVTDNPTYGFTGTGAATFGGAATFNAGIAVNATARQLVSATQSALAFGNTTDNQTYTFLGTGTGTIGGRWNFTAPSGNVGVVITGSSANQGLIVAGAGAAGSNFGVRIQAGLNSSDFALKVHDGNGTNNFFLINGDGSTAFGNAATNPTYTFLGTGAATFNGSIVGTGATGGAKGAGTINVTGCFINNVACSTGGAATTGTFTGTVTGMTAGTTGTVNYSVTNNIATMWVITAISGTSNVGTMTMTGLPAAVQPANPVQGVSLVTDTGATAFGAWRISGSTVTFQLNAASAFTTSGTKGILGGWTITYPL